MKKQPRISLFNQVKCFFEIVINGIHPFTPHHISLYLFILNHNNNLHWSEYFGLPFELAMAGSKIGSKRTYYKIMNDLHDWKLIVYEKGKNDFTAARIKVEVLLCTATDTATATATNTGNDTAGGPATDTAGEPLIIPLIYDITKIPEKLNTVAPVFFEFYDQFWKIWIKWKWYRAENNKPVTRQSEETAIKYLYEISGKSIETAEKIIEQSIANSWNTLVEIKHNSKIQKQNDRNDEFWATVNRLSKELDGVECSESN